MQNYGTRLRAARKNKGLTQIELAQKLGLSQTSYQRMKSGKYDLRMSSIYNICKTLNISSDWLIGLEN